MIDFSATSQLIAFCVLAGIAFLLLASDVIALIRVKKHRAGFWGVVFFIIAFILLLASFILSLMTIIKRITPFGLDATVTGNDVLITANGETGLPIPFIGGFMTLVFDYSVLESLLYVIFALSLFAVIIQPVKWKKRDEFLSPVKSADGDGYFTVNTGLNVDEDDFQPLPEDEYHYFPSAGKEEPLPEDGATEEDEGPVNKDYSEIKNSETESGAFSDGAVASDDGNVPKEKIEPAADKTPSALDKAEDDGREEADSLQGDKTEAPDYDSVIKEGDETRSLEESRYFGKPAPIPEDVPLEADEEPAGSFRTDIDSVFAEPQPEKSVQSDLAGKDYGVDSVNQTQLRQMQSENAETADKAEVLPERDASKMDSGSSDLRAESEKAVSAAPAPAKDNNASSAIQRENYGETSASKRRKRVTVKSNAAEMFSEYLMSRDEADKEKLEKAIDKIFIEHKRD